MGALAKRDEAMPRINTDDGVQRYCEENHRAIRSCSYMSSAAITSAKILSCGICAPLPVRQLCGW
jgi:hypothetical protein